MNAERFSADRFRRAEAAGRAILDRTTESLLKEFSKENSIEDLSEDMRFEHFSAFSMIRRHYSRAFSTPDVVIGGDGDGGIDAIAIIVNNNLVTDVDHLIELKEQNEYVEPTFIFVQAERSPGFTGQKIGSFGYGVQDFFATSPKLVRGSSLSNLASITDFMINEYSAVVKSPKCFMYYVTTGHWQEDPTLVAWREKEVASVKALSIFETVDMHCIGASELHALYKKTKAPITRTFVFDQRLEIPATDGVIQALLGYVPFSEFKKLLMDESGRNTNEHIGNYILDVPLMQA